MSKVVVAASGKFPKRSRCAVLCREPSRPGWTKSRSRFTLLAGAMEGGHGTREARRLGRNGRDERGGGGSLCSAGRRTRIQRAVDPRRSRAQRAGAVVVAALSYKTTDCGDW